MEIFEALKTRRLKIKFINWFINYFKSLKSTNFQVSN